MDSKNFAFYRKQLQKTQKQMAQLIGTSIKAVHSYEQGWRPVPAHVERQIYFLISLKSKTINRKSCWTINHCPPERKKKCPAYEFKAGKLCWFINGTICGGEEQKDWHEKMKLCRKCEVLTSQLSI